MFEKWVVIFYEGKMRIDLIAAARPNFMKISPIIDAIRANPEATHRLRMRIEKAGRFLDWRPAISLRSGLAELMDDALLSFPKD